MQKEISLNHAANSYRSVRGFTLCEQYIQLFSLFLSVFFAWLSFVRLRRPFIETIPTHDFTITETSKDLRYNGCSFSRCCRRVLSFQSLFEDGIFNHSDFVHVRCCMPSLLEARLVGWSVTLSNSLVYDQINGIVFGCNATSLSFRKKDDFFQVKYSDQGGSHILHPGKKNVDSCTSGAYQQMLAC